MTVPECWATVQAARYSCSSLASWSMRALAKQALDGQVQVELVAQPVRG